MKKVLSSILLFAFIVGLLCVSCNDSQTPSSVETKTSNDTSSNNNVQLTQEDPSTVNAILKLYGKFHVLAFFSFELLNITYGLKQEKDNHYWRGFRN